MNGTDPHSNCSFSKRPNTSAVNWLLVGTDALYGSSCCSLVAAAELPKPVALDAEPNADAPKAGAGWLLPKADGGALLGVALKAVEPNADAGWAAVDVPKAEDVLPALVLAVLNAAAGAALPKAEGVPNALVPVAAGVEVLPKADVCPKADVPLEGCPNALAVLLPLPKADVPPNAEGFAAEPNAPPCPAPPNADACPNALAPVADPPLAPCCCCCCCCSRFLASSRFLSACLTAPCVFPETSRNLASASPINLCSCCTYPASCPLALAWYAITLSSSGLTSLAATRFGSPLAGP